MKKVYRYSEDFGRMGNLEGLFVADHEDMASAMGREVCLGEVLGKHSDIVTTIDDDVIKMVSDNPVIVTFLEEHLDGSVGMNPLSYLDEDYENDDDDEDDE